MIHLLTRQPRDSLFYHRPSRRVLSGAATAVATFRPLSLTLRLPPFKLAFAWAVPGSSIDPITTSVLGCLRRLWRTSKARTTTPITRTASVTTIGPAAIVSAATAAKMAEAGMVKIHAHTMRRATPQRTALNRRVAPAPRTEPDTTCVVLTGNPQAVASWITVAATVCAANPWTGFIRTMRGPHRADDPPAPGRRPEADRECA